MDYDLFKLLKSTVSLVFFPEKKFKEISSNPSFSFLNMFILLSIFGCFYYSLHMLFFHFNLNFSILSQLLLLVILNSIFSFGILYLSMFILLAAVTLLIIKKILKMSIKFNKVMVAIFFCSNILILGPFIDLIHILAGMPIYKYNNIEFHIALPILFLIIWYQLFYFLKTIQKGNKSQHIFLSLFLAIISGIFLKGPGTLWEIMLKQFQAFVAFTCRYIPENLPGLCFILSNYLDAFPLILILAILAGFILLIIKKNKW